MHPDATSSKLSSATIETQTTKSVEMLNKKEWDILYDAWQILRKHGIRNIRVGNNYQSWLESQGFHFK